MAVKKNHLSKDLFTGREGNKSSILTHLAVNCVLNVSIVGIFSHLFGYLIGDGDIGSCEEEKVVE